MIITVVNTMSSFKISLIRGQSRGKSQDRMHTVLEESNLNMFRLCKATSLEGDGRTVLGMSEDRGQRQRELCVALGCS